MKFLHTDSGSGLSYYSDFDHANDKTTIRSQQDVEPLLDEVAKRRNSGAGDTPIASHMRHYAAIPAVVQLELMKKGIQITRLSDPEMWRKFTREVETNYPMLKVTEKKAWRPK